MAADIASQAKEEQEKHKQLWGQFSKCHCAYNAAKVFTEQEITDIGMWSEFAYA